MPYSSPTNLLPLVTRPDTTQYPTPSHARAVPEQTTHLHSRLCFLLAVGYSADGNHENQNLLG